MLTTQPYSSHPVWSPDGTAMMFSCDQNGDGFYETHEIDLTTLQETNLGEGYQADYWPNAYSPNGSYRAITKVRYIRIDNTWYWLDAIIGDPSAGTLLPSEMAWNADWDSYDSVPPTASLEPLPAISPAPPALNPQVSDDQSGIDRLIIQVTTSLPGEWQTIDPGSYQFQSGETYYFRIQAYDYGGNVDAYADYDAFTTIEWYPPVSRITSLPRYTKGNTIDLGWAGFDVGGSNIVSYQIQSLNHAYGGWQAVGTYANPPAPFLGQVGSTYSFRSSARDAAGNQEDWTDVPFGDSTTTLYYRAITGYVYANTGNPIANAEIIAGPVPVNDPTSQSTGAFAAYFGENSRSQAVSWVKNGYGSLPATTFTGNIDISLAAYLPPADNVTQNWDFEEDPPSLTGWLRGGTFLPEPDDYNYHTGTLSAVVGSTVSLSTPTPVDCNVLASTTTPDGVFHLICRGMYHLSYHNGQWSALTQFTTLPLNETYGLQVHAGQDNCIHILFQSSSGGNSYTYYVVRTPEGLWSEAGMLFPFDPLIKYSVASDSAGGFYILYPNCPLKYFYRAPNGAVAVVEIPQCSGGLVTMAIAMTASDQPIIMYWYKSQPDYVKLMTVLERSASGVWQEVIKDLPADFYTFASNPSTLLLPRGEIVTVWTSGMATWIMRRDPHGNWSMPIQAGQPMISSQSPQLILGTNDLLWLFAPVSVTGADGYSTSIDLNTNKLSDPVTSYSRPYQVIADDNSRLHLAYPSHTQSALIYRYQNESGEWQEEIITTYANDGTPVIGFIGFDAVDQAHFVYRRSSSSSFVHQYRQIYANQSGSSLLKQPVVLPQGNPILSFMYANNSHPSFQAPLRVTIAMGGETMEIFRADPDLGFRWEHAAIDLSPWAGQAVTLSFETNQTAGKLRTAYYIDEVSIGSGYTDVWAGGSATNALPGEQVILQLHYGNRSLVAAPVSTITLALPAGLTLLEAEPAPTEPGGTTWSIDALPTHSSGVISLLLEVSPEAPLFEPLTGDITITTSDELETANNFGQLRVRVGNYLFLPVIHR
ncbi:MAG TPA: hypothetical protein PKG95_12195, partial [Anaerolineaceae bacterium]|nr:hypothetical protein [Anaerolineaceae bacterium]